MQNVVTHAGVPELGTATAATESRVRRFATFAWAVLIYNLLVVLWGAYVRATGSGAGCGSHWPLCNGEVVPRAPQIETVIELTHRLTSGIALLLVVVLFARAFRVFPRRHPVRRGAALSLFFIITEALIGAGLVIFGLVAENDSIARALSLSAHLVNTFLLLGALALTAWWAAGGSAVKLKGQSTLGLMLPAGLFATMVLGMSGAVTALGDTLFPAASLAEGLWQDFSPVAHLLVRLRVLHPVIAVAVSVYLIFAAKFAAAQRPAGATRRLAQALVALIAVELFAGVVNVLLLAPAWMQLVHLLLADLLWVTLVLLTAEALGERHALPADTVADAATTHTAPAGAA